MKRALITCCFLVLSGCSWFSGSDATLKPMPLPAIEAPLNITKIWSYDLGSKEKTPYLRLVPSVATGQIFVANTRGMIAAFAAEDGKLLWQNKTKYRFIAGPGAGNGLILLGTLDGELIAFDSISGKRRWRVQLTGEITSVPQVEHDIAVARTLDGRVYGLEVATGKRLWSYSSSVPALTLAGTGSPVITGNTVLVGLDSGRLVALDIKNGQPLWEQMVAAPLGRTEVERLIDIDGDPKVVVDDVYVVAYQGKLAHISLRTGQIVWSKPLSSYAGLTVAGNGLYVVDDQSRLVALDRFSGASLWTSDKLARRGLTAPEIQADHIVVGDAAGYLHWLTRDKGQVTGRYYVDRAGMAVPPVTVGNRLYALGRSGELVALKVTSP